MKSRTRRIQFTKADKLHACYIVMAVANAAHDLRDEGYQAPSSAGTAIPLATMAVMRFSRGFGGDSRGWQQPPRARTMQNVVGSRSSCAFP